MPYFPKGIKAFRLWDSQALENYNSFYSFISHFSSFFLSRHLKLDKNQFCLTISTVKNYLLLAKNYLVLTARRPVTQTLRNNNGSPVNDATNYRVACSYHRVKNTLHCAQWIEIISEREFVNEENFIKYTKSLVNATFFSGKKSC